VPRYFVAASVLFLSACVLRPAWQTLAIEGQLQSSWLEGGQFRHRVLENEIRGERLRIYIGGDGGPWIREDRVSVDPTPTNPVLLRLMHGATYPAIYLGRPCYFGSASDKGCGPQLWTFDRYGQAVVDSMCEAANRLTREYAAQSVQLIGYSGGGAIVIGMSTCIEQLHSLVTIAGNLDPDAWTRHHGFSPLNDLSPMKAARHASNVIEETHWQCRDDRNVPPSITDDYFAERSAAVRHIVDSCSHSTGWEQHWPRILGAGDAD
jgi:hypothetical protein